MTAELHPTSEVSSSDAVMTLNDAAEQLNVHYMTAYRYVRTGRLAATKHKGQWWVEPAELRALETAGTAKATTNTRAGGTSFETYSERLRRRLIAADESGSWAIINDALTSGATPADVHTNVIAPAMEWVGIEWESGRITIAQEHQASSTLIRLLGRMTSMFRHPGRRRATAIIGSVAGEAHTIPTVMLSDLLSDAGYQVIDLGANTPSESFIEVAAAIDGPALIGLCITNEAACTALVDTIDDLRRSMPDVGLFIGGRAVHAVPDDVPVDGRATAGADAVRLFDEFLAEA